MCFLSMQQQYVLAELHEYLDSYPADAASTRLTVQYLEALNLIFEEGVLSHEQINSISSPVLEHMEQGYKFFTTWLESLLAEGTNCCIYKNYSLCSHLSPQLLATINFAYYKWNPCIFPHLTSNSL